MVQKTRAGLVVAVRGRAGTVRIMPRNVKTPGKGPSRNYSIMKEPEGYDLLVNSFLPIPKGCNSAPVRRYPWEIWTLWVGSSWELLLCS